MEYTNLKSNKEGNEDIRIRDPSVRRSAIPRTPPPSGKTASTSALNVSSQESLTMEEDRRMQATETVATGSHLDKIRARSHSLPECEIKIQRLMHPEEEVAEGVSEGGRPLKRRRASDSDDPTRAEDKYLSAEEAGRITKIVKETMDLTRKVNLIAGQLSRLVDANPNTKVEIKKGISELVWVTARLEKRSETITKPIADLIMCSQKKRVETVDSAVQTAEYKEQRGKTGETRATLELEEAVTQGGGVEDFLKVAHLKWPSRCYRKANVEKGDILAIPREWDLATLVPRDFDMDNAPNRGFRDHYQGLEDLDKQEAEVGEVAYLLENLSFPAKDGTVNRRDRFICYGIAAERARDTWHPRDLYTTLLKTKELLAQNQRRKIAWAAPNKIHLEYFKKAVEFAFAGSELETKIIIEDKNTSNPKNRGLNGKTPNKAGPRSRSEDIVIVKTEAGRSFADTLRKLKHEVDVESTGAKVAAIRKTRNGDVLMRLRSQQGGAQAESLREAIIRRMEGAQVQTIKQREATIHINGLDGITEKEELEEALKEAIANPTAMVKVNALWPAFGGCQNASATLHKNDAEELLKRGKIRVGWVTCRVRERLELQRCFKCWGYGHLAGDCNGVNRERACLKCGQEGHKAKECQNEEACWECGTKGHRGGSARCPKHRLRLTEAAKAKKRPPTQI